MPLSAPSPTLGETWQAELRVAEQELPASAGIGLAYWNLRVSHRFVWQRFGVRLCLSSCLNYPRFHGGKLCTGWGLPSSALRSDWSRQTKPNARPFVAEYAALWGEAGSNGGKIFFAGESHFRADAELRGKWVLKGEPALVDSSSPMHGEKASYYSAVCLETGEVEWMELEGNSNGESSVAFLERLRERHSGRLNVIWDNAPAHRGPAMRSYLEAPGLNLRLVTPHF